MKDKTEQRKRFIIHFLYYSILAFIIYICVKYLLNLILPFLTALILVALFRPFTVWINKHFPISKNILSLAITALIYILAGSAIWFFCAGIYMAARDFFPLIPGWYQNNLLPAITSAMEFLQRIMDGLPASWQIEFSPLWESLIDSIQNLIVSISKNGIQAVAKLTNSIPSLVMNLLFTVLLSFFISIEYDTVMLFIKSQLPERVKSLLKDTKVIALQTVFRYIKAYIILMAITFVELSIGLSAIGTKQAIAIAAGIAVFDALPLFGTGAIMIPWIILEALGGSYTYAFWLAVIYGIVTIVRNIIEPKIVGDQLGLHPVVSLMSVYVGYRIKGVMGMILFPILTQILLMLHQSGWISLYKNHGIKKEMNEK